MTGPDILQRTGTVVALKESQVAVELDPVASGCSGCHRESSVSCRGLFDHWWPARKTENDVLWVERPAGARKGSKISINTDASLVLKIACLSYGLPVLLLLSGALIGQSTGVNTALGAWLSPLLGAAGLFGGLIACPLLARRVTRGQKLSTGLLLNSSRIMDK